MDFLQTEKSSTSQRQKQLFGLEKTDTWQLGEPDRLGRKEVQLIFDQHRFELCSSIYESFFLICDNLTKLADNLID
jgi:hypothetical protein